MNTVEIGNITRHLPSEWNELTREQLIRLAPVFQQGVTVVDFKVKILFAFLRMSFRKFRKISEENAYYLGETLNF